ncbi:TIGR01777 family oxidoreductase [Bacillus sp. 165]|uniref:TIGR01777 family oxidoreductase n=1 Tax=Bacillus sp. 165 TaxID=1529117 RepID=UPI001ADA9648|nr:TIGR01777 family oxidoreductase [Bacillus sp. 165]MBO9130970.1 TIGR01777 family oxidoreductase [Bacillus sp. 165]
MDIMLSGGTGFIGKALTSYLISQGHRIYVLTRRENHPADSENLQYVQWDPSHSSLPFSSIDAVINLAGEPINSGRWTPSKKEQIMNSRITSTRALITHLKQLDHLPKTFINASAVGYYGTSLFETFTEDNLKHGTDFLAQTVVNWENEAQKADQLGIRTIYARFGIVLGKNEGALPRMILPYQLFIGGTIGSGDQWVSWIHLDDAVKMIAFALENEAVSGPLNVTAPHPVTMKQFGKTISKVLNRPHWIPVPEFVLRGLLGEMSSLIVDGQKVLPKKAMNNDYVHSYSNIEEALFDILK